MSDHLNSMLKGKLGPLAFVLYMMLILKDGLNNALGKFRWEDLLSFFVWVDNITLSQALGCLASFQYIQDVKVRWPICTITNRNSVLFMPKPDEDESPVHAEQYPMVWIRRKFFDSLQFDYLMTQNHGAEAILVYIYCCLIAKGLDDGLVIGYGTEGVPFGIREISKYCRWMPPYRIKRALELLVYAGLITPDNKSVPGSRIYAEYYFLMGEEDPVTDGSMWRYIVKSHQAEKRFV